MNARLLASLCANAAAVLTAACTSTMQWDKPGATVEAVEADRRACAALAESYPVAPARRTTQQPMQTDRDVDRQLDEAQRVDSCMQRKGYSLRRT
jgi:hypothetical protein